MSRIIVVMPAFNAERTLTRTVADIPPGLADEVILVDDASTDETISIARDLGLFVVEHDRTLGYGGNQMGRRNRRSHIHQNQRICVIYPGPDKPLKSGDGHRQGY